MAVAIRTNGLHHAVSLGTIEVSSKPVYASHLDRSYDSDDENMSRRRLRHTSSTELYPRPSVYSKGDIREQYCLTDRQLSTIERSRRDRFFGCLSRRSAPQSFLGVCVGRRVPSDENLAYAPLQKYTRDISPEANTNDSYFRRQPASILSTSKMSDASRYSWMIAENIENASTTNQQSSYHCSTHTGSQDVPPQTGPATPRTKHVSFARSHTLTSFDDVNWALRSSGRIKSVRSQERLIGGKKPIIATGSLFEPTQLPILAQEKPQQNLQAPKQLLVPGVAQIALHSHHQAPILHQQPLQHVTHQHSHGHSHQHHHGLIHVHQFMPYAAELGSHIQNEQSFAMSVRKTTDEKQNLMMGVNDCSSQTLVPLSPEVIVVEKKFRNAMKTQATQTDLRKDALAQNLVLSPRTLHRVKVVSQGAQTNGIQNGKKLTKSLSEMPNGNIVKSNSQQLDPKDSNKLLHHDGVYRTFSEEPHTPFEQMANVKNIDFYDPPPPMAAQYTKDTRRRSSLSAETCKPFNFYVNDGTNLENYDLQEHTFDYERNSLPRRTCNYFRIENEYASHSLPRREYSSNHDVCKHITECSELMADFNVFDFTRPHLLPPPEQYCINEDALIRCEEPLRQNAEEVSPQLLQKHNRDPNRRNSMVTNIVEDEDCPFRRDDMRRQSMPIYVKRERLLDGCATIRATGKHTKLMAQKSEEKEIFIDFKPHISSSPTYRKVRKQRDNQFIQNGQKYERGEKYDSCVPIEINAEVEYETRSDEEDYENVDALYENIPTCSCQIADNQLASIEKIRKDFRKRSLSFDDAREDVKECPEIATLPSPCREEILANASTYPSSDSLANDATRDHSDGIWNESQVTVVTADHKDPTENSYNSNLLLTPSSKRKNLILQHQQRSSIDTDAFDLEEQFGDNSPTYSNTVSRSLKASGTTNLASTREHKTKLLVPCKINPPSINVTLSANYATAELEIESPMKSQNSSRRSSRNYQGSPHVISEKNLETNRFSIPTTDVSECSTNTDEYVTCTDTSKRTPGIRTPPTTTSSSSTTQVPVSTQSSQMEKTHAGSSFESASSLYSTRGEILCEDILQNTELIKSSKSKSDKETQLTSSIDSELPRKSPSHSISSTSSGSYNMATIPINSPTIEIDKIITQSTSTLSPVILSPREKIKPKPESVSDDERSEIRYSSSGYYESPHDEDNIGKVRRHRIDEDRKRRKTSMKLNIEKENMRALTSPIKKLPQKISASTLTTKVKVDMTVDNSLEKKTISIASNTYSPIKIKRFRPKIRRQIRRTSKDDSTTRRQKNLVNLHGMFTPGSTEKLLDSSLKNTKPTESIQSIEQSPSEVNYKGSTSPIIIKSSSEVSQLKAKSIESLRSVSPGSDSVFYSEADGMGGDLTNHCTHCGQEVDGIICHSVETIPCIEHEQDIVKPPSDFADSPVTSKTTQRLYKKMDKRFRSEERYQHGDRGRLYKTRQENIRAKSEERNRESSTRSPHTLRPTGSSPSVLPDVNSEDNRQIIYRGHYDEIRYTRLTDADLWTQLDHQCFDRHRDRRPSTESERSFHSKYQVILHRLVQRRCTLEMYHRQKNNTFQLISSSSSPESIRRKLEEVLKIMLLVWARGSYILSKVSGGIIDVDKTIVVKSDSGEFGFRIHGSKPVVVAAIEPETPAESSGLEVGDIIITVNGVQVLDKHHTEVVKIAHDGCDKLELQVARTIGVLMHEQQEPSIEPICSGYLYRQSGQAKGTPNIKKWVRRWFCLRPDNCLYYYKTEEDTQPVGAMIMVKHTIEHSPPEIGKQFAFKIDSGEGIPMYLAADSEEAANRWIASLKKSATYHTPWLDKCAHNLYQAPNSITRSDCFGYLLKLGSRWCGWSKRYCVLKDACLYFYQDVNSKSAFGMACLHGYKVASTSANASGKKNSFEVVPPEPKLRHYYFCAETEMEKKRWISALEYSIDRWIKSG